ncbi:porin [Grimontia sp. SpTr1]|uniref:porin n=1 Tax=Grimontia sp. SpTr1 TaxID=2995319 RepID=UPI00248BEE35|nr:porin [Grimontia sp. SpTr1]
MNIKTKSSIKVFSALSLYLLSHGSLAEEMSNLTLQYPNYFFGINGGYQVADDGAYNSSDPKSGIFEISGGIQFRPQWSVQLGYQFHGELDAKATGVKVNTNLAKAALRYGWDLENDFTVFGQMGVAYWDMEKKQVGRPDLNANGFSFLTEVGLQYKLEPNINLSVGYQFIDDIGDNKTDKYDSHALMVGMDYFFGD